MELGKLAIPKYMVEELVKRGMWDDDLYVVMEELLMMDGKTGLAKV